ncbi:MAG TPA: galactokinase family protein [Candidatus Limiplasma sp.]|nr:galactokinase family protein [Candidatus Limiplasma sp.]HRX08329.1 galactokinase family protein [Candidatus Limiplasma sp.]
MYQVEAHIGSQLADLYGKQADILQTQLERYQRLYDRHQETFHAGVQPLFLSAPGRIEICGNHTDHNRGKVLAAAVSLDTLAAVTPRDDTWVTVASEGHSPVKLNLDTLSPIDAEKGSATSLVRGIAFWLREHGYALGGFDAVTTSTVLPGSGLSSSAAFEVLVCAIFSALYNDNRINAVERAQCAQYAENVFFGKPSGLMDQMASSQGGMITIDFQTDEPKIEAISYDFAAKGFAIVVVNSGGSHDDLTHCYAAIPREMRLVAEHFGKAVLREVPADEFFRAIPSLRKALPADVCDRAILRAQHFYEENTRVDRIADALRSDDLSSFLDGIIASGRSSALYLQNIYATPDRQEMMLALMAAETLLEGKGAWRVHGGGFAGTTLNFVPLTMLASFVNEMEALFGKGAAAVMSVRQKGPAVIRMNA